MRLKMHGVLTQDGSLEHSRNVVILKGSSPVRRSFLGTSPVLRPLLAQHLCLEAQPLIQRSLVASTNA